MDEYDNSVMKLFASPATAQQMRENARTTAPAPSHFSRFWSAVKKAQRELPSTRLAVTGIMPLALTEFAGSGANHLMPIESTEPFHGLYGLTRDEVQRGIRFLRPPLPATLQAQLLQHIEQQMNGYRLDPRQQEGLFNPARVVFCLTRLQMRWARYGASMALAELLTFQDDTQTKPAESALESLVLQSSESRLCLARLLAGGVSCEGGLHRGFTFSSMDSSQRDLISYLYDTNTQRHCIAHTS